MAHASTHHLSGGTANSSSSVGDSLLREDWPASSCGAAQRAETLRRQRTLPPRNHSTCAATGVFVERNPAVVLWLPRRHSSPSTLAKTVTKKACGTGSADGCDKSSACLAQGVDNKVSLRHFRSMWQGHISEHGKRSRSQTHPCQSSTSETMFHRPEILRRRIRRL